MSRKAVGLLAIALFGASAHLAAHAQSVAPPGVTQHQINDAAANLERARRGVVEDTNLRLPGENLNAYVVRIAAPLPNEDAPRYRKRIGGYLVALDAACSQTVPMRRRPTLQDVSGENQKRWQSINAGLNAFPMRLVVLKRAWKKTEDGNNPRMAFAPTSPPFALALIQTLRTIINASDALRDARP